MIFRKNYRRDQKEKSFILLSEYKQSKEQALESLIVYELAYGGHIINISGTKIVIETKVLSKIDQTCFEGSSEEIEYLLEFCYVYLNVTSNEQINKHLINKISDALQHQNVLIISQLSPFLKGTNLVKITLLCLITKDHSEIEKYKTYPIQDLVAFYNLKKSNNELKLSEFF